MEGMQIPMLVIVLLVALVFAISVGLLCSYFKDKRLDDIRADVYQLFLKAEHMYKMSGAGQQKMKWVVSKARMLLPGWIQAFVSEYALERIIEMWFREIKDLLDDGKVNGSQDDKAEEDDTEGGVEDE